MILVNSLYQMKVTVNYKYYYVNTFTMTLENITFRKIMIIGTLSDQTLFTFLFLFSFVSLVSSCSFIGIEICKISTLFIYVMRLSFQAHNTQKNRRGDQTKKL